MLNIGFQISLWILASWIIVTYVAYSPEKTIFQCLGRKLIIDWVNWPGSGATVRLSGPGASQGSLPVLCSQTLETGPGAGSDSSHPVSLVSPGLSWSLHCSCLATDTAPGSRSRSRSHPLSSGHAANVLSAAILTHVVITHNIGAQIGGKIAPICSFELCFISTKKKIHVFVYIFLWVSDISFFKAFFCKAPWLSRVQCPLSVTPMCGRVSGRLLCGPHVERSH